MASEAQESNKPWLPKKIGVVLFPTFQSLDVAGPLDVFQFLSSKIDGMELYLIAATKDPVSTAFKGSNFGWKISPTHTFDEPPDSLDVLFVPGGLGLFITGEENEEILGPIRSFIKDQCPKVRYLLTVCTGSALVAQTGVLDGLRATSNKASWCWVIKQRCQVDWVHKARWTVAGDDSKFWTSSGVSAGIDMSLAWVSHVYGEDMAKWIAQAEEYSRHDKADWDPFAELYTPCT